MPSTPLSFSELYADKLEKFNVGLIWVLSPRRIPPMAFDTSRWQPSSSTLLVAILIMVFITGTDRTPSLFKIVHVLWSTVPWSFYALMSCLTGIIVVIAAWCRSRRTGFFDYALDSSNRSDYKQGRKMRIFWDAAGGLHSYQMGVMTAVLENPVWKEKFEESKQDLSFEGASGGACTAMCVSGAVYGVKPLRWFFREGAISLIEALSKRTFGMIFSASTLVREIGWRYYTTLQDFTLERFPENLRTNSLVLWCSNARTLEAIPFYDFPNKESLGEALQATAYIPGLICEFKNWFFLPLTHSSLPGDDLVVDGGLAEVAAGLLGKPNLVLKHPLFRKKSRILVFETWPRPWQQKEYLSENIVPIQLWRWNDYTFSDIIIWGNVKWANDLYLRGYEAAVENMGELNEKLSTFFQLSSQISETQN